MNSWSRSGGRLAAGVAGALVGAVAVLSLQGRHAPPEPAPKVRLGLTSNDDAKRSALDLRKSDGLKGTILLAWTPGELPAGSERIVERTPGVIDATTVLSGLDWIESSRAADGTPIDSPPRGYAIPFEIAIIEPKEYAAFVPASERTAVNEITSGEAVMAATEANGLRGASEGLHIDLGERSVRVASVVSDVATNGYEALMRGPAPATWSQTNRFVLMHIKRASARRAVERRLEETLEPGGVLRLRAEGEAPFLRYGDAVMPQLLIKANFGEFAARPLPDGRIEIHPAWVKANIRSAVLPVLGDVGRVTCHRALLPQLRAALKDVAAQGLAYTIDPADYGGCFSPRFIDRDPGGRLSHHSWGIALDINARANAFGTKPDQEPQLVSALQARGFVWGGDWLIPDGMHFEWVEFP